ncbi:Hypothetical protein ADU71_0877 [Pediococcus damnosus]|nr:Hypothetical protein ADU71_0877 [Pediococcus damnosus]
MESVLTLAHYRIHPIETESLWHNLCQMFFSVAFRYLKSLQASLTLQNIPI